MTTRMYTNVLKALLTGGTIAASCGTVPAEVAVALTGDGRTLRLENAATRIEYSLGKGVFDVSDKASGLVCIRNAAGRVNNMTSKGSADRTWKKTAVEDALGKGQSVGVTTPGEGGLDLIQVFTLYSGRGAVVLRCGVRNGSAGSVRVKELAVLENARTWPGIRNPQEPKTLDGMSGWDRWQETKTRVEDGAKRWSYNNLLYTFKHGGGRRCLVLGGLTYYDFAKSAAIDGGVAHLYAKDAVGKRVDAGDTYVPADRFYIDASRPDPFQALETYGRSVAAAQDVRLQPYHFPTVCAWYAFRGGNHSPRCVEEIDHARKSGFLEYAPVGVRLVPDKYHNDSEQGWWDDEHWRKFGHYREPYETSEKFCRAIRDRGGLPFTYVQSGMPSDDYAKAFPGHMLRNDISQLHKKHMHHLPFVTFDYTDKDFQAHLAEVWGSLGKAGLQGVMFDYPETAWREEGGFDNDYSTCAAAYRKMFEMCREGLGPDAHLHERNLGWPHISDGTGEAPGPVQGNGVPTPVVDNAVGLVSSQRVMGDTSKFRPSEVTICGLRWYKCRTMFAYDMDSKAVAKDRDRRRAMLTMVYVVSGRLLLATSFATMTPEMVHDLSRTFPYHKQPKSARPIDLLLRPIPMVYDFDIAPDWHQLCLYNGQSVVQPATISAPLSGVRADGALGLDARGEYYVYDFWNDALVGRLKGTETLEQELRAGEARMLSVHRVRGVPQFISTNRHVMQGYVDLVTKPKWVAGSRTLQGASAVVARAPYELVFACNGMKPVEAQASGGKATLGWKDKGKGIAVLRLRSDKTADIQWSVRFE